MLGEYSYEELMKKDKRFLQTCYNTYVLGEKPKFLSFS